MSNMNNKILEDNKMIAEFMLLKFSNGKWYRWDKVNQGQGYFIELKYNSSWDWIIPAVDKFINETVPPTESKDINEYRNYCNRLHNLVTDYKIIPVFNCLSKAIKWYNKNKKS